MMLRAVALHESLHVKLENWYESLQGRQSGGVIGWQLLANRQQKGDLDRVT